MSVKAKVEAIIYATEEPVTINQLASLLREAVLAELRAEEDARLVLNETVSDGKPEPCPMTTWTNVPEPETTLAESAAEPDAEQRRRYFSGELLNGRRLDRGAAGRAHQGRIKAGQGVPWIAFWTN